MQAIAFPKHDPWLLLLAIVVLAGGSAVTYQIQGQARSASRDNRRMWLAMAALAGGACLWAAHFTALLAYGSVRNATYDPARALQSLLIGVGLYSILYFLSASSRTLLARLVAAAALGPAAAGVHQLGVGTLQLGAVLVSDLDTLVAMALLASFGGVVAGVVAGGGRERWRVLLCLVSAASGVVGLHFVGVAGLELRPGTTADHLHSLSGHAMELIVGLVVAALPCGALATARVAARSRREALDRLRVTIETLPAGVALFDPSDRLLLWNSRYAANGGEASRILSPGVSFQDLLRAGLAVGHYPSAIGREEDWIAERLADRQDQRDVEQRYGERWLRLQERRTPDGGLVCISSDITELKRDAQALSEARDKAEAANRAKDAFLANMSHELRTPLNGVIATSQVLLTSTLDPQQRELVSLIESSGRLLNVLLSDVLDLARMESGNFEVARERFNPNRLVREAAALWRAEAEAKGLAIIVQVARNARDDVEGDPLRVRQIIGNLVNNAVKFTAQGGLSIRLDRDPQALDTLRFTVVDTGIGFDPDQAENLFKRFVQGDDSIVRRFGGSGLGLSISRELAERMGGTITAKGRPGHGASFRLHLPLPSLPAAEPGPVDQKTPAEDVPSNAPLRILLAEDHPANRRIAQLILERIGAELTAVEDGAQALEAFRSEAFDAVLMDMQMPVMDGLAATRAIRDWENANARPRTPVFMLTANVLPDHVEASLRAGADRHLSKPIQPAELVAALLGAQAALAA